MSGNHLHTVAEWLQALRAVPVEDQVAYLDRECPDEEVRAEVLSLLGMTDDATDFFEDVVDAVVGHALGEIFVDSSSGATSVDPLGLEGEQLGRYRIEQHIGTGGMGVVYKSTDTKLNRPVALKFLSPVLSSDAEAIERFTREAQSIATLDHPRIATIYEIGEAAHGLRFIAMAYYSGETLKGKVSGGPLALDEAVVHAIQIAEGLGSAHDAGIIHRDVKPGNVIVLPGGDLKLVDFGLAKAASGGSITRPGRRMGTAAYMSPEMATSEAVDARSDLWALGVMLYEMVTGEKPFMADQDAALLYAIVHRQPRRPFELRPDLPLVLDQIIMKLLAKAAADRYQLAGDVLRDLEAVQRGDHPIIRVPTPTSQLPGALAVLPFKTIGNGEARTLTQGVHGDLVTRLSTIADLRVISRRAVCTYEGTDQSIRQIGRALHAAWIMEGVVQVMAERVRVQVRLIDARTDQNVWAKNFQQRLTVDQLFLMQKEITCQIVRELQAHLSPQEKKRIGKAPTADLAAYRWHAEGRRKLDQRTERAMRKAVDFFERATAHDPEYAQAWAGLADALALLYDYGHARREHTLPRAMEAAEKALALDPELAAAHASLGLLHSNRHEGPKAIVALLRAVELQPSYAEAHNWLSWNYALLGDADKALERAERAVALNPISAEAVSNLSASSITTGDWGRAVAEAKRGEELEPAWATPTFYKGVALYHLQRFEECIEALDGLDAPWSGHGAQATVALAHAGAGRAAVARNTGSQFETEGAHFAAGLVHAALGEMDRAFASFAKITYWDDWPTLAAFHYYPDVLGPVRADTRWASVVHSLKRDRGVAPSAPVETSSPRLGPQAVAVIPFADLGGSSSSASFAVGFHHDLLSKLARISGLTVISSAAVQQYENIERPMRQIARELNVGTIVKGAIQETSGRLRLRVQLLDARNDSIRWAETYDRALTADTFFDIQTDLATGIASSLRTRLTPQEKEKVEVQPTDNMEAHMLCTHGRTHMARRTEGSIRRAFELFQDATQKAPDYALAWAGLAEVLALSKYYGYRIAGKTPDEMEVARRAVALDPLLPEAHCSLGIRLAIRCDGPAAARSLARAVELQPSYAEAQIWLGWIYMILGDCSSALSPAERAVVLDPIAPYNHAYLGEIYLADGQVQKALKASIQARHLQPDLSVAHLIEGLSLYHLERYEQACFALQQAESFAVPQSEAVSPALMAALYAAHVAAGSVGEGRKLRSKIEERADPFALGIMHAVAGNYQEAWRFLMAVEQWGVETTPCMRYFFPTILGPIRAIDRYSELVLRIDRSWSNAEGGGMR